MQTKNIFGYMNDYLKQNNYVDITAAPINEIIDFIILYLNKKYNTTELTDMYTLFKQISEEEKSNIIFLLLNYISSYQQFAITWYINKDNTPGPSFEYSELYPDKLEKLNTTLEHSYEQIFNLVLSASVTLSQETLKR